MIKNLTIITPIFNQWVFTEQYIKDISHLGENCKIILVDNGSTDDSYKKATEMIEMIDHKCKFMILHNSSNKGFGCANNRAYKFVDDENVLFLNNDIRVSSKYLNTWTDKIFEYIEKFPNVIFSPTAGLLDDSLSFVYETQKETDKWNYLSGWCLFGSKETFDKIVIDVAEKEMDEGPWFCGTFAYFEDTYMSLQCKQLAIDMKLVSLPGIQHIGRRTGRTMNLPVMYNSARDIFINKFKERGFKI